MFIDRENLQQKLWRYRGVLLVACIPAILLVVILALLFNSSPLAERYHSIWYFKRHGDISLPKSHTAPPRFLEKEKKSELAAKALGIRYAVVLDAGSTGSRVHVFKFKIGEQNHLQLISDTFAQLKPGLSAYPDAPLDAAKSLDPLMQVALKTVPEELQASTPISLKATAGLRMLPQAKTDKILANVTACLLSSPFAVHEGAVSILEGQQEGAFAWLTLNYLLGRLHGPANDTVAAIDLGGGSVQEAFAVVDPATLSAAPEGSVTDLKVGGHTYHVYVRSYLGYGLMAGRTKVIQARADTEGHPCIAPGFRGAYNYSGRSYPVTSLPAAPVGDAAFTGCAKVGEQALGSGEGACGPDQPQCKTSGGSWRGTVPAGPRNYYVASYFWDRAQDSGLITNKTAIQWTTKIEEFGKKAKEACGMDAASVSKKYPGVSADSAPFLCLDLSYLHALLTHGFKFQPSESITLVKQVEYNGQSIEAAWPLGAALQDLA